MQPSPQTGSFNPWSPSVHLFFPRGTACTQLAARTCMAGTLKSQSLSACLHTCSCCLLVLPATAACLLSCCLVLWLVPGRCLWEEVVRVTLRLLVASPKDAGVQRLLARGVEVSRQQCSGQWGGGMCCGPLLACQCGGCSACLLAGQQGVTHPQLRHHHQHLLCADALQTPAGYRALTCELASTATGSAAACAFLATTVEAHGAVGAAVQLYKQALAEVRGLSLHLPGR